MAAVDERTIERAVEERDETPDERRIEQGGVDGLQADDAARTFHEGSVEHAERFADAEGQP